MPLEGVRGFVFDIDGTLVHRTGPEEVHAIPGAREVIDRIVASGRPFAVFTNGNTGSFFDLEATEGRVADDVLAAWWR